MAVQRDLFLDTIVTHIDKWGAIAKRLSGEGVDVMNKTPTGLVSALDNFDNQIADARNATPILLRGDTIDDLAALPREQADYSHLFRLPFPQTFFEFSTPLPIKETEHRTKQLRGILIGKARDIQDIGHYIPHEITDQTYRVKFFSDDVRGMLDINHLDFDIGRLPEFRFATDMFAYTRTTAGTILDNEGRLVDPQAVRADRHDTHRPDMILQAFERYLSLSVNIVAFINAHNVRLVEVDRNRADLASVNAKRLRKGKQALPELKPFYWVDIKEVASERTTRTAASQTGKPMDYRERVRGHFRRFHTREGLERYWIDSYDRGPEDAPWKENRYRISNDIMQTYLREFKQD